MSIFTRTKRVTYPLDDKIKTLIMSGDSSGSECRTDDSASLSDLVDAFLFGGECTEHESNTKSDPDPAEDSTCPRIILETDQFRNSLLAHVYKAVEMFSCVKSNKSAIRRSVMGYLRESGFNAAICKTRWESSGGLTAGSHEFIDVVTMSQTHRYFIEIDFTSEFEIARPTSHYEKALSTLPPVFIGTKEELKQIVKGMSESAKKSLKSRGLSLPPWRKNRFMQNKWFGSCRRTVNVVPLNSPFRWPSKGDFAVKCRFVGFDAVNSSLGFPPTARTR